MRNLLRSVKLCVTVVAAAAMLASATLPSSAATGTVRIRAAKVGFIIGVGGGEGVLHFRGRNYPLRVSGISAGTIGVARSDLIGTAFHLRTAADIEGSYSAVGAGLAVAGGGTTARLRNANGVILELRGVQVGFAASLGVGGVTISLAQ
jgi:hypothetical protein